MQELITYAGIVLVDVDARTLTGAQIETLTTAVRDLGRGLVTIGGRQSYGVGGYRESPLSDLLPVDSEIIDPQRRKTVAEVLSIDTSESMARVPLPRGPDVGGPIEDGRRQQDRHLPRRGRAHDRRPRRHRRGRRAGVELSAEWVIELQQLPPADVVDRRPALAAAVRRRRTSATRCDEAAEALIASNAELKHIILFTDGFTDPRLIADDGGGGRPSCTRSTASRRRCSPPAKGPPRCSRTSPSPATAASTPAPTSRQIPQIMAEEAVIASRNFITEGEFLPEVTSDDDVVADLTASPPLLGYVATTAKPQASTLLRIGPDRDPLLARWQAGLGRVTSWTSDATNWSARWADVGRLRRLLEPRRQGHPAGGRRRRRRAGDRARRSGHDRRRGRRGPFPDGATARWPTISGPGRSAGARSRSSARRSDRFVGRGGRGPRRAATRSARPSPTTSGEVVLSSSRR